MSTNVVIVYVTMYIVLYLQKKIANK